MKFIVSKWEKNVCTHSVFFIIFTVKLNVFQSSRKKYLHMTEFNAKAMFNKKHIRKCEVETFCCHCSWDVYVRHYLEYKNWIQKQLQPPVDDINKSQWSILIFVSLLKQFNSIILLILLLILKFQMVKYKLLACLFSFLFFLWKR